MTKWTNKLLPVADIPEADVCLVVEGTYPYVAGGVGSWAHELIRNQKHLTFSVVAILAPGSPVTPRYEPPSNLIGLVNVVLQDLPTGKRSIKDGPALFRVLEKLLLRFHKDASFEDLKDLIEILRPWRQALGSKILLDSELAWDSVQHMYEQTFPGGSFIDYFWSWRSIFGGLFSLLLPPIPQAKLYHTLCTGFAGLYGARCSYETGKPVLLTEHGIYTNERRIELGVADWFREIKPQDLSIVQTHFELREFWAKVFATYSRMCYEASSKIVTLFKENQNVQLLEGAERERLRIIPNGVDYERFAAVPRRKGDRPAIALIGRVVPIKGVKTFLLACQMIRERVPNVRAMILGPTDEDLGYYEECEGLVSHLGLKDTVEFKGQVRLDDYLGEISVVVLTSVSEAQPLVILEAGAAGIPAVATNVGACRDMILGQSTEEPPLGVGGGVCPVSDPSSVAREVLALLENDEMRVHCGRVLSQRVGRYYTNAVQHNSYRELYAELFSNGQKPNHKAIRWQG